MPLTEELVNLNFRSVKKSQIVERDNGSVWVVSDFSDNLSSCMVSRDNSFISSNFTSTKKENLRINKK